MFFPIWTNIETEYPTRRNECKSTYACLNWRFTLQANSISNNPSHVIIPYGVFVADWVLPAISVFAQHAKLGILRRSSTLYERCLQSICLPDISMRFLGHLRSRSKLKSQGLDALGNNPIQRDRTASYQTITSVAAKLPVSVLKCIFAFVCPHTQDESYTCCEESMVDQDCFLCCLRDLSSSARVCRLWFNSAQNVLWVSRLNFEAKPHFN